MAAKLLRIVPERCTHCMQCELACGYVQTGTFTPSASVIKVHIFEDVASYAPYTCFQCDEAWCMTACPVNAIAVHPETGAKTVIPEVCIGCKLCVIACPFGTTFFDARRHVATKCTLCDGDPACVHACPTAAIEFVETDEQDWGVAAWAADVQKTLEHETSPAQATTGGA